MILVITYFFTCKNVQDFAQVNACGPGDESAYTRKVFVRLKLNVNLKELRALQHLYPIQLLSAGNPIILAHINPP